MRILMLFAMLGTATIAQAQSAPRDFKLDTPPVPGQVVEPNRERLRLVPLPLRIDRSDHLGLPASGPKGELRESSNEPRYAPPSNR